MVIRLPFLKSSLWFIAILLMVMSFLMQVYSGSPYPSLLPYVVFAVIIGVDSLLPPHRVARTVKPPVRSGIAQLMIVYVALILVNTGWQFAAGVIGADEMGTAFTVYLMPVVFFWYFRRVATDKEIRSVLIAVAVAGFAVGAYFGYDSFLKLALGQISNYSRMASQYSLTRSNLTELEANAVRIAVGYRSLGLLESHSVSGTWVILGALASLAFLPAHRRVLRRVVILVFGTMLLLGLNFTSIITYGVVMVLFEFGGSAVIRGRISARAWRDILGLMVVATLVVLVGLRIAGDIMSKYIGENLTGQLNILFGTSSQQRGMGAILVANIKDYFVHIADFPMALLIGDGFTGYGGANGGDIGHKETLMRLGLPFFAACGFGLVLLIVRGIRQAQMDRQPRHVASGSIPTNNILHFSVCVVSTILLMEEHYSVWGAKSVLPIIFCSLALFDRYLAVGRSRSPASAPSAQPGTSARLSQPTEAL
jgi:hypothetical protein